MPQISATISESLMQLVEELAADTGQSVSALIADFIKQGAYNETKMRIKVEDYRSKRQQRIEANQ